MELLKQIAENLEAGEDEVIDTLTKQALDEGITARQILDGGLIAGMDVVGKKFRDHEIFLPEVLLSARAMYAGLDILKPLLEGEGEEVADTVIMGSVQGDLHDIGKNLVSIMLRGAGFNVVDLGSDVAPETFISKAEELNAKVIGMSALLTTTMPVMKQVVTLVKDKNLPIKTVVGGAPVSKEFADQIGADNYGFDATSAVEMIRHLVGS